VIDVIVSVAVFAITQARAVAERWVTTQERPTPPKPLALVAVPEDLHALALNESEEWAQSDMLRVIREKFEEHQDWNRVRRAMGVGVTSG
jgi:hypothetical protein